MGYPSDVTDEDWKLIEKYFERPSKRGAVPKHDKREIVNAILYVARGGVQWRMLPSDFPPWKTVYDHYSNWCIHVRTREQNRLYSRYFANELALFCERIFMNSR